MDKGFEDEIVNLLLIRRGRIVFHVASVANLEVVSLVSESRTSFRFIAEHLVPELGCFVRVHDVGCRSPPG